MSYVQLLYMFLVFITVNTFLHAYGNCMVSMYCTILYMITASGRQGGGGVCYHVLLYMVTAGGRQGGGGVCYRVLLYMITAHVLLYMRCMLSCIALYDYSWWQTGRGRCMLSCIALYDYSWWQTGQGRSMLSCIALYVIMYCSI